MPLMQPPKKIEQACLCDYISYSFFIFNAQSVTEGLCESGKEGIVNDP
jgi:hypothetical protein